MKPKFRSSRLFVGSVRTIDSSSFAATRPFAVSLAVAVSGLLAPSALADYLWNNGGGDSLYSNPANWTGTNTDNNLIENGDAVVVNSVISWNPNDLLLGVTGGSLANPTSGTLSIISGSLSTNYWTKVGDWGGNATFNIAASTTSSPGTYTGLDLGSGSYTSGALNGNGNILVGLYGSTGVLNVNTSGTLTASGIYVAPNNVTDGGNLPNSGGTFNLDAGTVNVSGDVQIGSDFFGQGSFSNGKMNMSGGTMNVGGLFEVGHLGLGVTSGTSIATISGGTLNVENDLKLGFAGNTGTTAKMVIENSAVVNVGSSAVRWVIIGQYDPQAVTMEVSNGGTLNLNAGTDIQFGINGNSGTRTLTVDGGTLQGTASGGSYINLQNNTGGGTSTMNIQGGGIVAVDAIVGGSVSTLNFDDGTLKATASDGFFIGDGFTVNINAGGATLDTNGHDVTDRANMAGAGALAKTGSGTLTLSGASTYTGDTTVSAGTLLVTGSLGATDVTVESGATIGGPGSLSGNLFLNAGAGFLFSETDTLSVTGTVSLDTSFGVDDLVGLSAATADGTYTLIDGTSTDFSVLGIQNWGEANKFTLGANKFAWFESGSLDLVVVPEPGAAVIGSLGMFCLLRRRRRA
ncbi:MAG: autotransporter-associated beta strand repeat-containing protein [Akkermansiaceae bacterium]|nr:autotransporter-associated beta strand repeat-containing protein [Akkermansiaceae bacterium]MCP5547379.1 autotransporter-associated beta strand repeat-containing protein [Akkermansiaceae bacterium]